jgi:hypothetical protein
MTGSGRSDDSEEFREDVVVVDETFDDGYAPDRAFALAFAS